MPRRAHGDGRFRSVRSRRPPMAVAEQDDQQRAPHRGATPLACSRESLGGERLRVTAASARLSRTTAGPVTMPWRNEVPEAARHGHHSHWASPEDGVPSGREKTWARCRSPWTSVGCAAFRSAIRVRVRSAAVPSRTGTPRRRHDLATLQGIWQWSLRYSTGASITSSPEEETQSGSVAPKSRRTSPARSPSVSASSAVGADEDSPASQGPFLKTSTPTRAPSD